MCGASYMRCHLGHPGVARTLGLALGRALGRARAGALSMALAAAACGGAAQTGSAAPPSRARHIAFIYTESGRRAAAARSYWTTARIARARPWLTEPGVVPAARPARPLRAAMRVGALFSTGPGGDHFCTASVVASPGRNMLITAAHCIHGGKGKTYRSDVVFVPGYRDGSQPFGVWTPQRMLVSDSWATSSDPDMDVAFIMLQPLKGKNIEEVLGANRLGINQGFQNVVRVTGYPRSGEEAITCINRTTRQGSNQMRFACQGYAPGTSGSPWLKRFDPATHTGMIIGVIGGYQQGGDTPSVSYSPYFGSAVENLYQAASQLP